MKSYSRRNQNKLVKTAVLGTVGVIIVLGAIFAGYHFVHRFGTKPQPPKATTSEAQTSLPPCRSGDSNNHCKVDLMAALVPVVYDAKAASKWRVLARPEDPEAVGKWYDYGQVKWANAVSLQPGAIDKYKGQDLPLEMKDVAAFWTYVPRYAYEVQRRDVTDKPVAPNNFVVRFETVKDPVKVPAACKTGKDKDYRTQCGLERQYDAKGDSTWATHPAFTAHGKQLNGIWLAKFEVTGTDQIPTVLPNQRHISGQDNSASTMTAMAGIASKLGGKSASLISAADWGAAAYLAASQYGAGYDKVQPNTQIADHVTGARRAGHHSVGTTGCGPAANGTTQTYGAKDADKSVLGGVLGTALACDAHDASKSYDGNLGQLASTTGNVTGIYDMAGGGMEYTTDNFKFDKMAQCTWQTCGGRALYEVQSATQNRNWLDQRGEFLQPDAKHLARGGRAGYSHSDQQQDVDGDDGDGAKHGKAGLFYSGYIFGLPGMYDSVRVVLR